jgi:hypothetical protein
LKEAFVANTSAKVAGPFTIHLQECVGQAVSALEVFTKLITRAQVSKVSDGTLPAVKLITGEFVTQI